MKRRDFTKALALSSMAIAMFSGQTFLKVQKSKTDSLSDKESDRLNDCDDLLIVNGWICKRSDLKDFSSNELARLNIMKV